MAKKSKIFFLIVVFVLCFFYANLIYKTFSPKIPTPQNQVVFYSNQCQKNLRNTVIKAIRSAEHSIHLVMFGLSDDKILKELNDQAKKNLQMNIYYDLRSSPKLFFPNDCAEGIKKKGLLHQKILVIDNKTIFLGSTNLTRSSLSMHNNLIIGLHSPEIARFLSEKTPFGIGTISKNIGGQKIEIWLLPDKKNIALDRVINIIRSANKTIKVAMFTLTHPRLIEEIINAKKRKVITTVVVDYHSGNGASAKAIEKLKKENIEVLLSRGPELLHHKYLLVDEKTLVCGSANWTKAAFSQNRDLLLIINNLNPSQKHFMNKLQQIIEIQAH